MNKTRLEWIDVCKGILISTIVFMHIDFPFWSENAVGRYINSFTSLYKVSIFFCVAGLTLKDNKLKETRKFVWGKVKSLWLKAVVIGIIAVLCHNVLISFGFYGVGIDYKGKIMFKYGMFDFIKQGVLTLFMANREVIIGPMWYAYVLFLALLIIALLDWFTRLVWKNERMARYARLIISMLLMLVSSLLTNVLGITIPRFNNTFTAVFLIDFCQFLYIWLQWKFDNKYMFILSSIIFINLPLYGSFAMANNRFENPAFLLVVIFNGMYLLYYISRKISKYKIVRLLSMLGKNSFWIMAFHFLAFKIGSLIINLFTDVDISRLTPNTNNIFGVVFYFILGIFIPCCIGYVIEKTKKLVIR